MFLRPPRSFKRLLAELQTKQQNFPVCMEVIQVFDRPASQVFYSVAGRLLFIESLNPELRNLIVDLFAGWQLTPVSLPDRSPDIRISFSCEETPLRIPHNLEQFEIADGGKCY